MPSPPSADARFTDQALPEVAAWTARLQDASALPVLATTARELEDMRRHEDRADANRLGELIAGDPLMTLKVMAQASMQPNLRPVTDMGTVTATLVMMGIPPFFRLFGLQATIDERLAGHPDALAGLRQRLRMARRAADFALMFARQRMDPEAPIIHATTLLHDFAELLIWCHAPELAMRLQVTQQRDPCLQPEMAQRQGLNVELSELQRSLMTVWRLPGLLSQVDDERQAGRPNVKCVQLALRLARHSDNGWDDPALADDYAAIGELLNRSPAAAADLVRAV